MQQPDASPVEAVSSQQHLLIKIRCEHGAQVDPKFLRPHPKNPNSHPPGQIEYFKQILVYQGWRRPITVSKRSNYVTKGHGALETALAMGLNIVPVDYQDYDSEEQELADIVADNALPRLSEIKNDKLQEIIQKIDAEGINLDLIAIPMQRIDTIMLGVEGWGRNDADLSVPIDEESDEEEEETYASKSEPAGGPAHGEPLQEDLRSHLNPTGAKELSRDKFSQFKHKCPKCEFEFD